MNSLHLLNIIRYITLLLIYHYIIIFTIIFVTIAVVIVIVIIIIIAVLLLSTWFYNEHNLLINSIDLFLSIVRESCIEPND